MRRVALVASANLALAFVLCEIMLRIAPAIIPPAVLIHFEPGLRGRIAAGRLPTVAETTQLRRDDGGFPLRAWKPGAVIRHESGDPGTVAEVTMDEIGFCNDVGSYQRDSLDIIALGDSFTWCLAVHPREAWPQQLGSELQTSVYSLGKDGVGLYEHLQILKHFGIQKRPRIVILNVYEGNDLRDAVKYRSYRVQFDQSRRRISFASRLYRLFDEGPLRRHSYAVNTFAALAKYSARSLASRTNFRYHLITPLGPVSFNLANTDTDEPIIAHRVAKGELDFTAFDEAIRQFVSMAGRYGFTPIVAYTPSAHTAYARYVSFEDERWSRYMPEFSERQREYLSAATSNRGAHFVDLTPALEKAAPKHLDPANLLYYQTNLHLTRQGHAVIAAELGKFVRSKNPRLAAGQGDVNAGAGGPSRRGR